MKKTLALALTLVMALGLLAGCGGGGSSSSVAAPSSTPAAPSSSAPNAAAGGVTVTDMTGRTVTLDAPAEKVVAITAATCEILYAVGAGDTLVGRGEYCDYPDAVLEVESVQSGYETNIEQIIALQPQVVLMDTMAQTTEQIEALESAGIQVVVTKEDGIEGVYTAIELIGAVVGKADEAAALVGDMKASFASIADNVPDDGEKKTVYFEVSPLEYGLWTAGGNTFMNELAEMLGAENIFADLDGWAEISQEQVIERNPDIIITITMYFGEGTLPEEEIMAREGWQSITAIKNQAVYNADSNEISRPGPRLVEAAQALNGFIYG